MDSDFKRKSSDEFLGQVKRRAVLGDEWRLEQALQDSEDSVKLNTSYVERLSLTIQLGRRLCRLV